MKTKMKISLSEIKCEECGNCFFEIKKRPFDFCPHCKKELSFYNSQPVQEKLIEVEIDVYRGVAKIINH